MQKHLEKMWLETKFQPVRLRNDKDIGCRIDVHGAGMTCTPLYFKIIGNLFRTTILPGGQMLLSDEMASSILISMEYPLF